MGEWEELRGKGDSHSWPAMVRLSSEWERQGEGGGSRSSYPALSILRIITGPSSGSR